MYVEIVGFGYPKYDRILPEIRKPSPDTLQIIVLSYETDQFQK